MDKAVDLSPKPPSASWIQDRAIINWVKRLSQTKDPIRLFEQDIENRPLYILLSDFTDINNLIFENVKIRSAVKAISNLTVRQIRVALSSMEWIQMDGDVTTKFNTCRQICDDPRIYFELCRPGELKILYCAFPKDQKLLLQEMIQLHGLSACVGILTELDKAEDIDSFLHHFGDEGVPCLLPYLSMEDLSSISVILSRAGLASGISGLTISREITKRKEGRWKGKLLELV